MNATELSRALSGHAEAVCRHYLPRGRRQGRYWICGDVRGKPGKSMHVRLAPPGVPGKWTDEATGEHGDLLDLIQMSIDACELRDAIVEGHRFLSVPVRPAAPAASYAEPSPSRYRDAARRIWRFCQGIEGTRAEAYLRARAIPPRSWPALRFHPALNHRDGDTLHRLPAMVAAVTDNRNTITAIHRTWLDPVDPAKAPLAEPRKSLGPVLGNAVRFGPAEKGRPLIAGEGIETVLSVLAAIPGVAGVAALSANKLAGFNPPDGIGLLLIARDADEDGVRGAARLGDRARRAGIDAVVVPPRLGDFNDDLARFGVHAVADTFRPHLEAGS